MICNILPVYTGITNAATNQKVNPYQQANFTCYAEGKTSAPQESAVNFYRDTGERLDDTEINRGSTLVSGRERAVDFLVESVVPGKYTCALEVMDNGAFLPVTANTYGERILFHLIFIFFILIAVM